MGQVSKTSGVLEAPRSGRSDSVSNGMSKKLLKMRQVRIEVAKWIVSDLLDTGCQFYHQATAYDVTDPFPIVSAPKRLDTPVLPYVVPCSYRSL